MKPGRSLFAKLVGVIIVTGILINLLVGAFVRGFFMRQNQKSFTRNLVIYTDYLVRDMGTPPDPLKARAVAVRAGIRIAITGPGITWFSDARMPPPGAFHGIRTIADGRIGFHRMGSLYEKRVGPYTYTFISGEPAAPEVHELHLAVLLLLLSGVVAVACITIRRVLRPVRLLADGLSSAAGGDLDHAIPVTSRDELGELTVSFNRMRDRIKGMLSSRDQLLRDVSHELRSPLTRIKVALEFIDDDERRAGIAEDVAEIERMVGELLETERLNHAPGRLVLRPCLIAGLVHEAAGEVAGTWGGVIVEGDTAALVPADRDRVKTVFRNLFENARKHALDPGAPVVVTVENAAGAVTVRVRDRGRGIPAADLPFVFEPFYRADSSRSRRTGGYGLGLSLCRTIMIAHDGDIAIESAEGEGTTVILGFPAPNSSRGG